MFGTIRKLSYWITIPVFAIVIFSFIFFMASGPARSGNAGGSSRGVDTNIISGKIYGVAVTQDMYDAASHDVDLFSLFNYGDWPWKNPNLTKDVLKQQAYVRMMLIEKAKQLGVHVNDQQAAQAATMYLRSPTLLRALGGRGSSVPFDAFVQQILTPAGLTDADFDRFIRDDLAVQQLQAIYGMSGQLITPQEAAIEYVRQYQELSVQAVFFSASNFLAQTEVTPGDVGLYYTNFMAEYRLPIRAQVSYVLFSISNYLGQAEQELEKTNFDAQVNYIFSQYGMQAVPDAKTPEEAKATIRKAMIRRQALSDAGLQANNFAQAVFNVSNSGNKPASAQDLVTVARQKGLEAKTPAPFSEDYGPQDFAANPAFTRAAFELTSDSPISEPVAAPEGVYVIALESFLPSEIPPLDDIHAQVTRDLQLREAIMLAQRVGTNFVRNVTLQMAAGKSFAAASMAEGFYPETMPPFSLSTQELPELDGRASINQFKQIAFTTPIGMASSFVPTANPDEATFGPEDGGFVLFVESRLPVDQSTMAKNLPEFSAELREQRQMQMFNEWLSREANRELRNTPIYSGNGAMR
jgi:parvulin-like peptidyl-prolyl isomerase